VYSTSVGRPVPWVTAITSAPAGTLLKVPWLAQFPQNGLGTPWTVGWQGFRVLLCSAGLNEYTIPPGSGALSCPVFHPWSHAEKNSVPPATT